MNPENLDNCQSEWEIVQQDAATQTSNLSIDRLLKPNKPNLPLPRNLSKVDKSANTSYKSSIAVFDFCQVIQNPDDPGDIRSKSSPSDDLKYSPAEDKLTLSERSEIRYNYCKDIIKPFLKPDCPESEEEILNNAVDSLSEDFPDYQPCEFPDTDAERIRTCLGRGKIDVCTNINNSAMDNCSVGHTSIPGDTKIEIEISTVPLNSLVDDQALCSGTNLNEGPPASRTCSCPQVDECVKPVMEVCDAEDHTKDKTEDKDICPDIHTKSCVCITVTTSSNTKLNKLAENKSKESIKELKKESKPECSMKSSEKLIKKPSKESNKEINKEELDCFKKTSKESNKELNKELPSKLEDCLKKSSNESIKKSPSKHEDCKKESRKPINESPSKPDCGKTEPKESKTKVTIECKSSQPFNVVVSKTMRPEKCDIEEGPTIEGFADALDTHTKALNTLKDAMQDFVGKVCSSKHASDKPEPPKRVRLVHKVFDVSDIDKKILPKMADVINSMQLKVDSTLSIISNSIDTIKPECLKAPSVHSKSSLDKSKTTDIGNTLTTEVGNEIDAGPPVTVPTPEPVSNSMFYAIKDRIVSMFREPKSDISTRTSTFTNSSLESNDEPDS